MSLIVKKGSERVANDPRRLVIFSPPKCGKTELVAGLQNSLLIDLEDGSEYVDTDKINIIKEANKTGKTNYQVLIELIGELDTIKKSGQTFDYVILDTATALEDIAKDLAAEMYRKNPIGKNWTGTDILTLPQGAGYQWIRMAFDKLYNSFQPYAKKCLILLTHVKDASINKEGKEIMLRDVQLTGKLKTIVAANADAIGFLYRAKSGNENILSFKHGNEDLVSGARSKHLSGKEFIISKKNEDETLETYWDEIFID